MESLQAVAPKTFKALSRQRALAILEEESKRAGDTLTLDPRMHPDFTAIEQLRQLGQVVFVQDFDPDKYYEITLPYYRSNDRAKEHVLSHFESLYGRLPDSIRSIELQRIGTGRRWIGICALDQDNRRLFIPLPSQEPLREMRLTAQQEAFLERSIKGGKLSEVPRLS